MKVYLKHNGRYWCGKIGAFKDGSNIFFVTHESIHKAKDLGSEQNALDSLEWWCSQCGADPKEWELEIIQEEKDKPYSTCCGDIPAVDFSNSCNDVYFFPQEWIDDTYKKIANYMRQAIAENFNPQRYSYSSIANTHTKPIMQRTINEICKDAEYYFDDSVKLYELKREVESSQLTESHKGLALEIIEGNIEALTDGIRKKNAWNKLDRD